MKMNYLEYPLFAEGYVNRFLMTDVSAQVQQFRKSTLNGTVNEWLKKGFAIHENPCRKEFVENRKSQLPEYMDLSACLLETPPLKLYFPFGNTGVDASAFYYQPTYLRMYSYAELWSAKQEAAEFELETCGGVTVWLNDTLVTDFTPFTRNMVKKTTVLLPLQEGNNKLIVCLDDLAERDTDYYFRLKNMGANLLKIRIPVHDDVEQETLCSIEEMLEQISFEKEAYISEMVKLTIHNPFDRELKLDVIITPGEFVEKMEQQWRLIEKRPYTLLPGQTVLELFESDEIAPGYCYFTAVLEHRGITIQRKIGNQLVRKDFLEFHAETLAERKKHILDTVIQYAPEGTYKAAALLKQGIEYQRAEHILLEELEGVIRRKDCSDFHFIIMLYLYHTFQETLSPHLKEELEHTMLNYRYWIDEPGDDVMWFFSENHALLFHCCQYLAGSYLPDRLFVNSSRMGKEVSQAGERLLHEWFEDFFREFITEWNSNAYIPVDVLGIGTLYNLTEQGSSLHAKAKRALDMIFYSLSLNAHKGAIMTSFGRTYEKEMKGNYNAGTTSLLYLAYDAGYLNRACNGCLPLALGDYEAPPEYRQYLEPGEGEELIFQNTQGYEKHVNLYLYKNDKALLSTAIAFKPFEKGYQEHVMQATIDELAQAFVNHPGEAFPYGSGRPNYWAGNSVLPLAVQYQNLSILRYHIPEQERIDYTHAYIPLSAFSRYQGEDGVIVLEKDGAFLALKALNGLKMQTEGPNQFREFISPGRDNVWVIRVGSVDEYGGFDALFESFKKIEIQMSGLNTTVTDEQGNRFDADIETWLTVNGRPIYKYPLDVAGKIELGGQGCDRKADA